MKLSPEVLADLQIKKLAARLAEVELHLAIANAYVALGLPKEARIDTTTGDVEMPPAPPTTTPHQGPENAP